MDGELVISSWLIPHSLSRTYLDSLQTHYVHSAGLVSFQIQWLSQCRKLRSLHLQWKQPNRSQFEYIPSSVLFFPLNSVFSYPDPMTTCRMNKFYTTEPLVDDKLLQALSPSQNLDQASISFSSLKPLPQGLSLDPRDGTISGYPTCEVTSSMVTIQMDFQQYHFEPEVRIEVMGCRYIDYESLNSYSITKSN